jgi:hypothetical protein
VSFIDSAGIGELFSSFATVSNSGGRLVLVGWPKNLLRLTVFSSVFESYEDELTAIREMDRQPLNAICPVCESLSSPGSPDGISWPRLTCANLNCGAQFTIGEATPNSGSGAIESVRFLTYPDEYIEAVAARPFRIVVVGRLNLFTCSGLKKLWSALPARIGIVDLLRATEISEEGRAALLGLISSLDEEQRVTISLQGVPPEHAEMFAGITSAYADDAAAVAALGRLVTKTPQWTVRFQ